MIYAVRCPSCRRLSRVGAEAVGRTVACPHCGRPFPAAPEPPPVARRPARPRGAPVLAAVADDSAALGLDGEHHAGPSAALVALVLLPLGIPLLWLAGPALTGVDPIFSFATPVALAVCLCGLGLGVGYAHGWSHPTRVKAVVALLMVGYFTGGFLFFVKKEWAEAARRHVGPGAVKWQEFRPPHDKKAYRVKLPGPATPVEEHRGLPGWGLKAYRFAPDPDASRSALELAYEVAHGVPAADVVTPNLPDEEWFAAARKAVAQGCDGEVTREREVRHKGEHPGREYVVVLPDGATNRIVRVYRVRDRAFYLSVEGVFVPDDARYVRDFFESFLVDPK